VISTVTTSTVTTISTMVDIGVIVGTVAVGTLVALVCARELAGAAGGRRPGLLARSLNVSIVPLLMVFIAIVVVKVLAILA
jgi:hypothetical protein